MTKHSASSTDRAHFSLALFGFYGCCAMVSIGAALFFFAWLVLTKDGYGAVPLVMKVVGAIFMIAGIPGCFLCLSKARAKGHEITHDSGDANR